MESFLKFVSFVKITILMHRTLKVFMLGARIHCQLCWIKNWSRVRLGPRDQYIVRKLKQRTIMYDKAVKQE